MQKLWILMMLPIVSLWGASTQEAIEEIFGRYHRDVTVLVLGEFPMESIFQLAGDHPRSVFVLLGSAPEDFQEEIREYDLQKNVIWLNHSPSLEDIQALSLCEHFDIIILHPFSAMEPEEWKSIALICRYMSHHVVVKTSLDSEEVPYVLENHFPFQLIKRSFVHPRTIKRTFTIYFDYNRKFLIKVKPPYADQMAPWRPGINLITYLMLNGHYPDRLSVVYHLPLDFDHRDWMPNNMILQGRNIELIDKNDPSNEPGGEAGNRLCKDELMHAIQLIIESQDKSGMEVKRLFCELFSAEDLLLVEESD